MRQEEKTIKIPVRFIKEKLLKTKKGYLAMAGRIFSYSLIALVLILNQTQALTAFEAHVINVEAQVCDYSDPRTMGYWKNHSSVYLAYLPLTLGCQPIETEEDVEEIFDEADANGMIDMLKGQLLAMKFNIAHSDIGGYEYAGEGGPTLNDLVALADDMVCNPEESTEEEKEEVKDLLDDINNLEQIRHCSAPNVRVIIPNGGEEWWVGRSYDLTWATDELNCPSGVSIDIWYSRDSGKTFAPIATSTDNDGVYNWRIGLFLNGYFVPSSKARIKVVAKCAGDLTVAGWDISDRDFCPPIDYSLLTPEELEMLEGLNLENFVSPEEQSVNPSADDNFVELTPEETFMVELTPEEGGLGSNLNDELSDEVEESSQPEEDPAEEEPVVEEEPMVEEEPVDEEVIEEVIEEEPIDIDLGTGEEIIEEIIEVIEEVVEEIDEAFDEVFGDEPVDEPLDEPINEPVEPESTDEPVVSEPTEQPASEPAEEPEPEPEPAPEPVPDPEPVSEPAPTIQEDNSNDE